MHLGSPSADTIVALCPRSKWHFHQPLPCLQRARVFSFSTGMAQPVMTGTKFRTAIRSGASRKTATYITAGIASVNICSLPFA
jgi:hypothetical protein